MLDYASRLVDRADGSLHLLNIISVPGDVPVKFDGEVLDNCTEFDLSGYLKEKEENQNKLNTYLPDKSFVHRASKVGDALHIINHCIETNHIDLIISGAHVSSTLEDVFSTTFADRLMHEVQVPYITLKCERGEKPVNHIGILREWKEPKQERLDMLKKLREKFDAQLTLFKINTPHDTQPEDLIIEQMKKFCEINGLEGADFKVVEAEDKVEGTKQLVAHHLVDLLALGHVKRKGAGAFLRGELKTDILNHVTVPMYLY